MIRCVCVCEGCSALESHVRASVTVCLSVCVAVGVRRAVCIVIVDFALYEKNVHQPWPLALKYVLAARAKLALHTLIQHPQ